MKLSQNITDEQGLNKAYSDVNNIFVNGDTMYISGTHSASDAFTDLTIPFHLLGLTHRYKQAEQVLKLYPEVKNVVGHSLGGSLTIELVKNNSTLKGKVYGSPNIFPHKNITYYRHRFDPVSTLNQKAYTNTVWGNPHSYTGY